jgi:Ca2+-binding RTX toxin-like protein
VALLASSAGISYEEEYGQIILHYSDNTSVKIYKVEEEDGEVVDFKDTDYTVALGNKGDDDFKASNKDSVLDGYEGDDILTGGDGHDWLKGGKGSDAMRGGKGHDIILIDSEDKQANIDGGEDYDIAIVATAAGITLDLAKANIEAAYGNRGNDRFTAKDSNAGVMIDAGDGDDDCEGSDHADNLTGGNGKDKIRAGKGDDHIHIDAEDDLDGIDGGEGIDMLLVYGDKGVTIDAAKLSVESIAGTSGNDVLSNSGDQKVELRGEAGKDRLIGGKGDDINSLLVKSQLSRGSFIYYNCGSVSA